MKIFISYSKMDEAKVNRIYQELLSTGETLWLDKENLIPGQNWENEIKENIIVSDMIVIVLSNNSIHKKGYFQKELKLCLKTLEFMPMNELFIIPVRIDDCRIPEFFEQFQYVDLFKDWNTGFEKIKKAISLKKTQKNNNVINIRESCKKSVNFKEIFEGIWRNNFYLNEDWHCEYFTIEEPNKYLIVNNLETMESSHCFDLELLKFEGQHLCLLKHPVNLGNNRILMNTLYIVDSYRYEGIDYERKYNYTRIK